MLDKKKITIIVYTLVATMIDKRTVQALERMGLSAYEAKAYLALLSEPLLTGYKLSKVSGVPRSRIYETVEKLMAKGLVVSRLGETTVLKPVSLESFLEKQERDHRQNIDFLKEALSQVEESSRDQGIWNLSGREQILEAIEQFISQAKKHIYIVGFSEDLKPLEEPLARAEKRRVKVFGVYCGKDVTQAGHFFIHQGQPCSTCQDIAMSFDSKQALVGCTVPAGGATAALTQNPGIIYIIEQYIKHEILISQLFQSYDQLSQEKFKKKYQQIMSKLR